MMRLVDLNPRWIVSGGETCPPRRGMGIRFDCPVHRSPCVVAVWFENPTDHGPKDPNGNGGPKAHWWTRIGDDFDSLTLTPSIHVKDADPDNPKKTTTHWHGSVTAGEVT